MTIHIDKETALAELRAVVTEFGDDYVYGGDIDGCVYVLDGQPSCIVGQVLHRVGVPITTLETFDTASFEGESAPVSELQRKDLLTAASIALDSDAFEVLRVAQKYQDNGHTWGTALAEAVVEATYQEQAPS